jgi:hypothetical protein
MIAEAGLIRPTAEETMQIVHRSETQPSLVTAVFQDAALSFEIPAGATLEDLADYIADLGELHGGSPLVVDVQLVC